MSLAKFMKLMGIAGEKTLPAEFGLAATGKLGKSYKSGPLGGVTDKLLTGEKKIVGSSFPPVKSCPGCDVSTFPCKSCLGTKGQFIPAQSKKLTEELGVVTNENQMRQYLASLDPNYSKEVASQILRMKKPPDLFRSNIIGDLYSQKSINDIDDLAKAFPMIDWYSYTKSYRGPKKLDFVELLKNPNAGILQSIGQKINRYENLNPDLPIAIARPPGKKLPKGWLSGEESDVPSAVAALSKSGQRVSLKPTHYQPEDVEQMLKDWEAVRDMDASQHVRWNAKDAQEQLFEETRKNQAAKEKLIKGMEFEPGSALEKFMRLIGNK